MINILYIKESALSIIDNAIHDGMQYYITYTHDPIDGWNDYHITTRSGLLDYDSHGLGWVSSGDNLKLKYDSTINKMTVVETKNRFDGEIIFNIEEDNPLFYESVVALDNHLYYLFSSCRKMGADCQNRIYSLYKCELNNTYCEQLPFMYDGKYGGYLSKVTVNENTSEIEIYFEPYFCEEEEFRDVLIYAFGNEPRCYVVDCYILDMP